MLVYQLRSSQAQWFLRPTNPSSEIAAGILKNFRQKQKNDAPARPGRHQPAVERNQVSPADNEVTVAIEKGTDVVRISVRNHGPIISADFKPHIFERFAQADATNARQKGGTGLGLSIVKQIVDRLGGDVGFADAPGGGTVFHVELPCWENVASVATDLQALNPCAA